MHGWRSLTLATLASLGLTLPLVAQPPEPAKVIPPLRNIGVKGWTKGMRQGRGTETYDGVVEKVEGRLVTWICSDGSAEKPKSRTHEAIDVLADGKMVENAEGAWAYLWADLQKGDTVQLELARDTEEDKLYVVAVKITGRKGGRVPPSQQPKEDEYRLERCNLLNDIENGIDVDDILIAKLFPMRYGSFAPIPAGLPREWQDKLDAIRAKKKEAELKAQPPEKKEK
jgi:hypothetical protein